MVNTDQLYRNMLENLYEGIYFVDAKRKITFWNKGAERITGFAADEVVNHDCYDNLLNHVDDFGNKLCLGGCPLHLSLEDGQMRDVHVYLHHKSGHRVAIKARVTPIYEDDVIVGAVEMFIGAEDDFHFNYELEELKALAYRDTLTGLPNRRMIDKQLAAFTEAANTLNTRLSIAFIDIDFFKKVNDTYGHAAGDEVLKMVALSMGAGIMKTDLLGRWGGEEFICIFRGATDQILKTIAERIRMLVESSSIRSESFEIKVTVSIGATHWIKGEAVEHAIDRADKLLYQSKQNGRNRVTIG